MDPIETKDKSGTGKRKGKFFLRSLAVIIILVITAILFHEPLLEELEDFLILDEAPKQVSVIIVPSGAHGGRVAHAVALYKQGYSDKLIMSGGQCSWKSTSAEVMKEHAMHLGIAANDILLEMQADTTYENAKYSLELMSSKGLKSAIVVTSSTHTKRIGVIFDSFRSAEVELTICATPEKYPPSEKWWQNDLRVQNIVTEYMKLSYYYLFQRTRSDD